MLTTNYLEDLCKKYKLPIFENPKDNFIILLENMVLTKEELWQALDIYESWLIALYTD